MFCLFCMLSHFARLFLFICKYHRRPDGSMRHLTLTPIQKHFSITIGLTLSTSCHVSTNFIFISCIFIHCSQWIEKGKQVKKNIHEIERISIRSSKNKYKNENEKKNIHDIRFSLPCYKVNGGIKKAVFIKNVKTKLFWGKPKTTTNQKIKRRKFTIKTTCLARTCLCSKS